MCLGSLLDAYALCLEEHRKREEAEDEEETSEEEKLGGVSWLMQLPSTLIHQKDPEQGYGEEGCCAQTLIGRLT